MTKNIFADAAELFNRNIPFALATIVETKGSAPRHNASLLVQDNGKTCGTVGGGMVERYVIDQALEALQQGKSRTVEGSMSRSGKNALGMDCGGTMTVHIDVFGLRPELLLVGGGHVNQAVGKLADQLGFSLTVADSWQPNLDPANYPEHTRFVNGADIVEAVSKVNITENTQVIIATNHEDNLALPAILQTPARHIGQLASRRKIDTLRKKALAGGISPARFDQVRTPVGLDIGAETPEEIAVSIMAEILAITHGKKASPMEEGIRNNRKNLVVIRGAGDLATGTALKLHNAGFKVVMLDLPEPTVIRTNIAFAQALLCDEGKAVVEEVVARKARSVSDCFKILNNNEIAVMADPECSSLRQLKPQVLVDAILAKRNLGTHIDMAPVTIALGPGFCAGEDVRAVIETCRGHDLARIIYQGTAKPDTGKPGQISGYDEQRVLRAPCAGIIIPCVAIGDLVSEGQTLATVENGAEVQPVISQISGKVRGMIHSGLEVTDGFKVADVDPRGGAIDHTTISDKARAIAGGVLEAIMELSQKS